MKEIPKVVGQIFSTSDYDQFILSPLNRAISAKHVRKLKKLMEKDGFPPCEHIIVHDRDKNGKKFPGGKLMIFDGQHTRQAARELGLPVPYMIDNNWKHGDARVIDKNTSQLPWTLVNYRDHWAAKGNKDYQICAKFMSQHPKLSLSIAASLLSGKEGGDAYGMAFKEGRFKVENVKGAKDIADIVAKIRKIHPMHNTNTFIKGIQKMYLTPKFDADHLIKKMQTAKGSTLIKWSTKEEYVKGLEDVYNFKTPLNKRVKFYIV